MPTFSTSATSLKYASGSSWTSGKARQGVYSSTRYEGAIRFSNLTGMSFSNVGISQIQLKVTFGPAGGSSTKYLTFYKATKNDISGSIGTMRGTSIGAITVSNAYDRTVTLTFNSSTNSAIYNTLKSYFSAGNQTLIIYVPSTRGTYDGGYCYDYLSVTAATLTFTYEYLQSDGQLESTSIAAGTAAKLNITAYNSAYTHNVVWSFGNHSTTQTLAAGTTSTTYTIPLSWLDAIPSATSGSGTVSLETVDSGGVSLGTYIYPFTVTVPASVVPSITSVTSVPVNTNSVLNGWGIYVYGKSQARITINGAAGKYGSTIKSYSITTDPSIGSGSSTTLTTSTLYKTGTVTIVATVTDSRGRTATKSTTISIYPYAAPYFTEAVAYRCNSSGTRDDTNGTYAYIKASFTRYALSGSNTVSASMTLTQIGGSYTTTRTLSSGSGIVVGDGNLAVDATYQVVLTVTDTVGSSAVYRIEINSAAYIIHVKKGGKAIGFGMAAGNDNTVSFGWPVKLSHPLEISQGGTGANSAASAVSALGAVKKTGDTMTGNLNITSNLYPSMLLLPTNGGTTNRTVFEGSYVGASSFSSWEDDTGNNRRMLEVRNAKYESSMDNAVVLRSVINGSYYSHRVFHAGMATPVPVANGGTGASSGKAALSNLGIFYADTLPASGVDGQICLVPI